MSIDKKSALEDLKYSYDCNQNLERDQSWL